MALVTLAVGNGAEMRLAGENVVLTVGGAVVAIDQVASVGPVCRGRCPRSVVAFPEGSPSAVIPAGTDSQGRVTLDIQPGIVVRFHNAVITEIEGDGPSTMTFTIPGETDAVFTL